MSNSYSVKVVDTARYVIQFQVNYPETSSVLSSSIDGRTLADVQSKVVHNAFATFACTAPIDVKAGKHTFVLRATAGPISISATLVDARLAGCD